MASLTHFKIPLRIGADGQFETWEQDSDDDVLQCIGVIAGTPIGTRVELPQFGIPRLVFDQEVPLEAMLTAIYTWEPRAMILVRRVIDPTDELASTIDIVAVDK